MPETPDIIDAEVTVHSPAPLARVEPHGAITGLFALEGDELVDRAAKYAASLSKVLKQRNLIKRIGQNEYVEIGGWQTLGGMCKVYCSVEWTRPIDGGWEARAVCHDVNGNQLAAAEAQCSEGESKWRGRDSFQIRSMAQTRAQSKAYRTALGFIVELAG